MDGPELELIQELTGGLLRPLRDSLLIGERKYISGPFYMLLVHFVSKTLEKPCSNPSVEVVRQLMKTKEGKVWAPEKLDRTFLTMVSMLDPRTRKTLFATQEEIATAMKMLTDRMTEIANEKEKETTEKEVADSSEEPPKKKLKREISLSDFLGDSNAISAPFPSAVPSIVPSGASSSSTPVAKAKTNAKAATRGKAKAPAKAKGVSVVSQSVQAINHQVGTKVFFELDKYMNEQISGIPHHKDERAKYLNWNPIKWWVENQARYPLLYPLACRYLSVSASGAEVERINSRAGDLTRCRSQLTDKNLELLVLARECRVDRIVPPYQDFRDIDSPLECEFLHEKDIETETRATTKKAEEKKPE